MLQTPDLRPTHEEYTQTEGKGDGPLQRQGERKGNLAVNWAAVGGLGEEKVLFRRVRSVYRDPSARSARRFFYPSSVHQSCARRVYTEEYNVTGISRGIFLGGASTRR